MDARELSGGKSRRTITHTKAAMFRAIAVIAILPVAIGIVTGTACSGTGPVTLTVSAAADLTYPFQELGKMFEEETGVRVSFNFGSTGQLARQVEQGAPVDLFAAASVSYIEDLDQKGMIVSDTRELYGRGFIVLWTSEDNALTVERLEDLAAPAVKRVAIANPDHAPYGIAARQALQSAGVWEQVKPKLVLGENVRQTLQYAETGNVDVAIVALSLAVMTEHGRWVPVAPELYSHIDQALAVVKGTRHEQEARAFAAFIDSTRGRPVMQRYGFVLPGEDITR